MLAQQLRHYTYLVFFFFSVCIKLHSYCHESHSYFPSFRQSSKKRRWEKEKWKFKFLLNEGNNWHCSVKLFHVELKTYSFPGHYQITEMGPRKGRKETSPISTPVFLGSPEQDPFLFKQQGNCSSSSCREARTPKTLHQG